MRGSAILVQEYPTYLNKIVIAHVDLNVALLKDINVIFKLTKTYFSLKKFQVNNHCTKYSECIVRKRKCLFLVVSSVTKLSSFNLLARIGTG